MDTVLLSGVSVKRAGGNSGRWLKGTKNRKGRANDSFLRAFSQKKYRS